MTREEAVKWLKAIEKKYIHGGDEEYDNLRKIALHMAMEALEQPSAQADLQPTCNQLATDCISRQAAIDALNHICPVDTEYDCTLLDRVDVRCVLSDLPSVQQEIIRCGDCLMHGVCRFEIGLGENGFCSQGTKTTFAVMQRGRTDE